VRIGGDGGRICDYRRPQADVKAMNGGDRMVVGPLTGVSQINFAFRSEWKPI
jgi:hypothetical protein